MNIKISHLPEPELKFNYDQNACSPHDGLWSYGPYSSGMAHHPKSISISVIGTKQGTQLFQKFNERWKQPIINHESDLLWPNFPGFEAAFDCEWSNSFTHFWELCRESLVKASNHADPHIRAAAVVDQYLKKIQVAAESDKRTDVIVCVVPSFVYKNCRPKSRPEDSIGKRTTKSDRRKFLAGERLLFPGEKDEPVDASAFSFSPDFRQQLKAKAMEFNIPIQILLEPTLELDSKERTPLSDRAWNIGTTMLYKAGGQPWKLASAREGVCYIGLVFKRLADDEQSKTACCAAQMFIDDGDGVVFRGNDGRWYSPKDKSYHLDQKAATALLSGLLKTYEDQCGKPLTEIFIHSHSSLNDEEYAGFQLACPSGVTLVCVRVRKERFGLRLVRNGKMPVLRGIFAKTSEKSGYLWGSGFKPRHGTYDGHEIPVPLRIEVQHGKTNLLTVAKDVFALTKLNYNACRLGESLPVTIKFSDQVGNILVSNPKVLKVSPKFKMYI